jgi:molybdate transport system ATP-binding protein
MLEARIVQRFARFTLDVAFTLTQPCTVIFGHSAAGKSTLLRILAGLAHPQHGHIRLGGLTVLDTQRQIAFRPGRRGIGYVQQRPALFPHRTVAENIAFGLDRLSAAEREQRIDEVLSLVNAQHLRDRRPALLSGGEGQRIAIARALAPKPKLLLLDEPLVALDAAAKQPILDALQRSGIPMVYVSHDLAEIWNLPAEVLLLEAGQITARGPLQQVLAPYRQNLLARLQA